MKLARFIFMFLPIGVLFISGCSKGDVRTVSDNPYLTWEYLGETYPELPEIEREELTVDEGFPVAGIVSHHLLAGELIDEWFIQLRELRDVKRFFILSPRHWDLGTGDYSLTSECWMTGEGVVYSDSIVVEELSLALGCEVDPEVFVIEHGIDALVPFISRHFPGADVIAINYKGEPPVNMLVVKKLRESLMPYFDGKKSEENFLLISSDFAHHGDYAGTKVKDDRTRFFMDNPVLSNWILAGCDNRPGMYLLATMAEKMDRPEMEILYHTNSYYLSGKDPSDITSYFFTYLYDLP
jgi:MEMO1 family protein